MLALICSVCRYTSKPATVASPDVGCDRPHRMRMAVVLPAPLAPRKPKISPRCTSNVSPSTAVKSPKRLVSFRQVMALSLVDGSMSLGCLLRGQHQTHEAVLDGGGDAADLQVRQLAGGGDPA